jgi:hypothetical protein
LPCRHMRRSMGRVLPTRSRPISILRMECRARDRVRRRLQRQSTSTSRNQRPSFVPEQFRAVTLRILAVPLPELFDLLRTCIRPPHVNRRVASNDLPYPDVAPFAARKGGATRWHLRSLTSRGNDAPALRGRPHRRGSAPSAADWRRGTVLWRGGRGVNAALRKRAALAGRPEAPGRQDRARLACPRRRGRLRRAFVRGERPGAADRRPRSARTRLSS